MSNARLIAHLEHALDQYERGDLNASDVERAVSLHVRALERIGVCERSEADRLVVRLVNADLSSPPTEFNGQPVLFEGDEDPAIVVQDFRTFIASLPA